MSASAGVDKVLEKTRRSIEAGAFYEAQQMIKTLYYRYRSKQRLDDSYMVLKNGAVMQLQNQQVTCGVELAGLLLEAYSKDKIEADDANVRSIEEILSAFPSVSSSNEDEENGRLDELSRFVTKAIKWLVKQGRFEECRSLHDQFGLYIWNNCGWKQLGRASMHFARGKNATAYAKVLHECAGRGRSDEADLFLARGVLLTLSSAHPSHTAEAVAHAQGVVEAVRVLRPLSYHDTPMDHYIGFALQALRANSPALFALLKEKYSLSLKRDPTFEAYIAKIEEVHLKVQSGSNGLFGGFLRSLFEDEDDE